MSVEKAKEFLAAVKEKTPDEGLREKAAAKIGEERIGLVVDMAHEMGYDVTEADIREAITQVQQKDFVVMDDDMLEGVSGGTTRGAVDFAECPKREKRLGHIWDETGNTRPGSIIGWIDDVEYKCKYCGDKYWGFY